VKKVALAATSVAAYLVTTAATAFAQSTVPPPDGPVVQGDVVTPPGGTAFTGSDTTMLLITIAVGLLALGIAFVVAGRRRAASNA
jgi:hypothetical protein